MKYFLTHRIIIILLRPYQHPREMSAKNIMILDIKPQFTSEYIANLLWKREIAKVSSITLIPQIQNGEISHIAYINIVSFCDTEVAYDFVKNMSTDNFIFCHHEGDPENPDNFWIIQKNIHNSGNICVGPYTTLFIPEFFEYDIVETDSEIDGIDANYDVVSGSVITDLEDLLHRHDSHYNVDEEDTYTCNSEEWEEFTRQRPIKGLSNDYYSVDEALEHLLVINNQLDNESRLSERVKLEEEFEHFEKSLRIWEDTEGFNLSQEAIKNGKELYMCEVCPSLYIPRQYKREVAGKWYEDMQWTPIQQRREVAMSVDEYYSNSSCEVARNIDKIKLD